MKGRAAQLAATVKIPKSKYASDKINLGMPLKDYKELLSQLDFQLLVWGMFMTAMTSLKRKSVTPSIRPGTSLIGATAGRQHRWVVIGYEDSSADPIFIDSDTKDFPCTPRCTFLRQSKEGS